MEDDKLKELFKGFRPELSPEADFMSTLAKNMEVVERVKKEHGALKRRSRIAVCVAALVGFLAGTAMTLVMPTIVHRLSAIEISLPAVSPTPATFDFTILGWIVTAATCAILSYNAYELTVSKLSAKE